MANTAVSLDANQNQEGLDLAPIKKVSIICSKGSLDMAYPGLILANAARMSGIEATLFFTFWGLDIITKKKMEKLDAAEVEGLIHYYGSCR